MMTTTCIVLAAGEGTRMKSDMPKVMHKLAGRSMLGHVLANAQTLEPNQICVVVGPNMDTVANEASVAAPAVNIAVQHERLGTGDAVKSALPVLDHVSQIIIVLFGDTPLVHVATLEKLKGAIAEGAAIAVLGFRADNPHGYGRLLTDTSGALTAIREEADASEDERQIGLCNSGVMAFDGKLLDQFVSELENDNAKGEYYLTDAVELADSQGLPMAVVECPEEEVLGVNNRSQLAVAEAVIQNRLRESAMENGATLVNPESVFLSYDTNLGKDVHISPHVVFGVNVTVDDNVNISAFSHLEGAHIKAGAQIGPYARLRPGTKIGEGARIGNFVEIKNTEFNAGAKANHLSYVGDSFVGENANIGAGTITCNYDGKNKFRTHIGANAFVGSNSSLIAPVKIGDGAYIGSSSVITKDVKNGSLALSRAEQREIPGWAERKTAKQKKSKK
ncbi:MAG: bifunctional UDP-N-acetylglucosamine diphosphorylase/glucosamine-1-phosphate N-acetyltransferase GlmU [Hyphomicrobiales bacterium]